MEKFAVDLDKVLDEFEFNEDREEQMVAVIRSGCSNPLGEIPVTSRPHPVARRKKRLQISASKTLSVIPEPKESECSEDNTSLCQRNRDICTSYCGSLRSVNTYRTCKSGELSDYCQWYDASEDELCDFQDCESEFYEPFGLGDEEKCDICSVVVKCEFEVDCKETNKPTALVNSHGGAEVERMTEFKGRSKCNNQDDDFSFEDAVIVTNGLYPSAVPDTPNGSSSRREKGASGFFSFLRWFRKTKDDNGDGSSADENIGEFVEGIVLPSTPSSVRLIRTQSSSCGSIDTLFSTATVNSFSFVSPTAYRPYGTANLPEKRIAVGPDTDTYRNRLVYRERARELDKNLTLKKKYRLFGSDTQLRSLVNTPEPSPLVTRKHEKVVTCEVEVKDQTKVKPNSPPSSSNSTFGRKKRRAPAPPDLPKNRYNDYSLPSSWAHKGKVQSKSMDSGDPIANIKKPCHRRTVSDSSKDRKAGAYCHVKGKRRAPPPPTQTNDFEQQNGSTLERFRSQFPSLGRKKRPAPQPPTVQDKPKEEGVKRKKDQETQSALQPEESSKSITKLSPEEKERLIANISKLKAHANRKSMGSPPSSPKGMHLGFHSPTEHIVCNDSLKLERGVLKPNKELPKVEAGAMETKPAPVSPRPWYKRSLSKDTSMKRDIFKSLEKKKDRDKEREEDWMPEVGYPRIGSTAIPSDGNSTSSTTSKFNIFSRLDKNDEKKREGEKRKSQVSMLANISELDREAAEIVQKEQAREQAIMAAHDAKFYSYPDMPGCNRMGTEVLQEAVDEPVSENVEVPKRSSAKELISLFNAIGNVTKVTVNSAFFSKDGSSFFSREGIEKRFSFMGESVRTSEERVVINKSKSYVREEVQQKRQSGIIDFDKPLVSSPSAQKKHASGINGTIGSSDVSDVTIEEVEDEKSSKVRAIYEANRSRRHHSPSPSIPTIVEQSESTTPASTINPGSNRDSIIVEGSTDVTQGGPAPEALQHAKRLTIWACPRCTLENPRWKLTCDACGRWRPSVPDEKVEPARQAVPEEAKQPPDSDPQSKPKEGKLTIDWEEELKRYFPSASNAAVNKLPAKTKTDSKDNVQTKIEKGVSQLIIGKSDKGYMAKTDSPLQKIDSNVDQNKLSPNSEVSRNIKNVKSEVPAVVDSKPIVNSAAPSTFIGGRTKQDEKKQKVTQIKATKVTATAAVQAKGKDDVLYKKEPDIDEVRKARIAFFNRTPEEEHEDLSKNGIIVVSKTKSITQGNLKSPVKPEGLYAGGLKLPSDENEMLKLKEMLKEMKDSLPKRPKNASAVVNKSTETTSIESSGNKKMKGPDISGSDSKANVNQISPVDGHRHGAIKKTPRDADQATKPNAVVNGFELDDIKYKSPMEDSKKVEALFITTKTVYEDIKVKKGNLPKPLKVSTSVQTSSVVRKVAPVGTEMEPKLPLEKQINCNTALPVTVEELSTTGVREGMPHIGTRTFELIRARDFATIEATKTGGEIGAVHLYANLPPSPVNLPSIQQPTTAQKNIGSHSVSPVQQPPSPLLVSNDQKQSSSEKSENEPCLLGKEEKTEVGCVVEVRQTMGSPRTASGMTSPSREAGGATSEASSYSMASVGSVSEDNSEVERLTAQLTLPKGLAEFKANLQAAPPEQNMNTLAVNRLLRRLEAAIAGGQHHQAAGLAKDLARLKISCSVTRQRRSLDSSPASITVDMYVEDKVSHQGPIPLQVTSAMTVAQLKQKVEQEFEIPAGVQRWILGKLLASDDTKTLEDHNVSTSGCPMFLYLVAPDGDTESEASTSTKQSNPEEPVPDPSPTNKGEKGGGWYYNNEEDHYSFCEDTESEMTEDDDEDDEAESSGSGSPLKELETQPKKIEVEKVAEVVEEEEEEEEDNEEDEDEEEESDEEPALILASAVIIHDRPTVVEPAVVQRFVKPVVNQSPRPFRSAAATSGGMQPEVEVPAAQPATGTLKLGWKCPTCTLVNSPTRPGCAACTTERPLRYVVPVEYRANEQELQRMQQEQQLETQMQQVAVQEAEKQHQHYQQLVNLDNTELVPNVEAFDCSVCLVPYNAGEGVVLRECLHTFCKPCLVNTVQFNEEAEVKCPYRDADYACDSVLQEREIKALVPPNVYEKHLAKSVSQAENKIGNAFHCKTPDCRGWCIFEDNVNEFRCPVCRIINCLTCQAIHDGINCKQYQEQVKQQSETNAEARRTKEMLEEMVVRGEAMACPTCQVVLMKKWGCDWLRCSMCKTEICWVTRGPRWGPGGKGDTTGGCQCGLNGVKCHPRCNYCH